MLPNMVLGAIGVTFILLLWGPAPLFVALAAMWGRSFGIILIAIPMFVLMANYLRHSGIGDALYEMIYRWLGGLRGGLAIGTIIIGAIVGAMSGVSAAATIMMGVVALPSMLKRGYNARLTIGSISGGGSLGILIPPSILMCIYGIMTETSIGNLFAAGIIPGIVLAGGFIVYIGVRCFLQKHLGPPLPPEERATWRQKFVSLTGVILPIFLIAAVMGSIFFGIASITEASVVGATGAIICTAIYRRINWQVVKAATMDTFQLSGMIMWVIFGATAFSAAYIGLGAIDLIRGTIVGLEVSPIAILFIMMGIVMIMGCFMDGTGILMITLPVFLPICHALGIDLVWFGILFTINLEMGMLTPPFGGNLFYMRAVVPRETAKMTDIYIAMLPFIAIQVLVISLLIFLPEIALWLPRVMVGGAGRMGEF
jgi:tripartite ATP-independent transporter DctM subunit